MTHLQEQTKEELNKPYENFLTFVAFTILLRLFDFIERLTNNTVFQVIIALIIAMILLQIASNNKLSTRLRTVCEKLKMNTFSLHAAYLILYFFVLLVIF